MALSALFIGGTGIISTEAARRAVADGVEVTLLNRGRSTKRPVPDGARVLHADVRDPESVRAALGDLEFDAVVEFTAFTPEHV
ncbi:NAD-dependent epimerase/dehydratase family protein, partial [Cellulomonas sp. KH9]|uniref:NAD-dependent epimerase/dehydratase family protein n=1 Tax=Cellulomonas sp. KH9 TaxID=1855324 RepID=UPI0008ED2870